VVVGEFQSYVVFWCYHSRLQFKLAEEVFALLVIKALTKKFEESIKKFKRAELFKEAILSFCCIQYKN
jgi:hypothetical protein